MENAVAVHRPLGLEFKTLLSSKCRFRHSWCL